MPGVAGGLPAGPLAALMALPEGNPYRAVAERSYRPKLVTDDAQWELALPLFIEILAADPRRTSDSKRLLDGRRCTLARHVYWLAGEHPDRLNPDFALDEIQVERSALLSEGHVTYKSQISYKSQLGSFRTGFPKLFPTSKQISPPRGLEPTGDRELLIALNAAETFRNDGTCDRVRAMLLLCRGAGLDSVDCRYVAGTDVFRRPGAGLWVRVTNPEASREVRRRPGGAGRESWRQRPHRPVPASGGVGPDLGTDRHADPADAGPVPQPSSHAEPAAQGVDSRADRWVGTTPRLPPGCRPQVPALSR